MKIPSLNNPPPSYTIRYVKLNSNEIINALLPRDPIDHINRLNHKNNFYERLEKSILKDGIINPILINAGWCYPIRRSWLPPGISGKERHLLFCDKCGGSRLWVAQKYNLEIPCIVSDFYGRFVDQEQLFTIGDILKKFRDKPKSIKLLPSGVHFTNLPHSHLR